ncbi:MAG: exosortase/archaeosortase family protein [Patescibacteria group bacterium]
MLSRAKKSKPSVRQEIEIENLENEGGGELKEKATFQVIFLSLAVLLIFLPFITTFNEVLTRVVEKIYLYTYIEDYIVPYLSRLVGVFLLPFGFKVIGTTSGLYLPDKSLAIDIAWNCIGWQSMILIIITFFAGLQGEYTKFSKGQTILIGVLGTFIINVLRIASVVLVAVNFGYFPAVIYHDYFSNLLIVLWLFLFWWFTYAYVLEPIIVRAEPQKKKTNLYSIGRFRRPFFPIRSRIKNLFSRRKKKTSQKSKKNNIAGQKGVSKK